MSDLVSSEESEATPQLMDWDQYEIRDRSTYQNNLIDSVDKYEWVEVAMKHEGLTSTEYESYRIKIKFSSKIPANHVCKTSTLIYNDTVRTYSNKMNEQDQESVYCISKIYCQVKGIEYKQGMSYYAATIYLNVQDEYLSFRVYNYILSVILRPNHFTDSYLQHQHTKLMNVLKDTNYQVYSKIAKIEDIDLMLGKYYRTCFMCNINYDHSVVVLDRIIKFGYEYLYSILLFMFTYFSEQILIASKFEVYHILSQQFISVINEGTLSIEEVDMNATENLSHFKGIRSYLNKISMAVFNLL